MELFIVKIFGYVGDGAFLFGRGAVGCGMCIAVLFDMLGTGSYRNIVFRGD